MTTEADKLMSIDSLLPKSLDDIVRQRRDLCTIRLSSPDEIAALERVVVADAGEIKGRIDDWRFVCLDRTAQAGGPVHVLLGFSATRNCPWSTSPVIAIDLGTRLAVTRSGSIYQLHGPQGAGEPDMHQRIRLCVMLNVWGWGESLGVPPIFY